MTNTNKPPMSHPILTKHNKNAHPGYAVRYIEHNDWLCCVHGLYTVQDPFYATIFSSEKEAKSLAEELIEERSMVIKTGSPHAWKADKYEIIPAWEPLCEQLRFENSQLRKASNISMKDVDEVIFTMENAINILKQTKDKKEE